VGGKFSTNPHSARHDSHTPLLINRAKERVMVHMREQEKTLGSFAMLFFGMKCVCLVFGLSTQMLQLV